MYNIDMEFVKGIFIIRLSGIFNKNACNQLEQDLDSNEYGYFIVRYDFSNISVEVINTKGYKGNYTLTQINELTEE